jgi:hypothetical protein
MMVRQGTECALKSTGTRWPTTAQASAQAGQSSSANACASLEPLHPIGLHPRQHVGDIGMPIPHPDIHRHSERLAQQLALQQGPLGQRRALRERLLAETDLAVAMLQLLDHRAGKRPAAGDFLQILRHLAQHVGGAVRQQ